MELDVTERTDDDDDHACDGRQKRANNISATRNSNPVRFNSFVTTTLCERTSNYRRDGLLSPASVRRRAQSRFGEERRRRRRELKMR